DPEHHIDETVDHEQPHGSKVPKQRASEPVAEGDGLVKFERKERRGVIDLPTRADHHHDRHRIDPMGDAYPSRMDRPAGGWHDCGGGFSCHRGPWRLLQVTITNSIDPVATLWDATQLRDRCPPGCATSMPVP